jgi:acyl homoserine lactone synthase
MGATMHILELRRGQPKDKIYLDQVFSLRAKIFSGRLAWDVEVSDGMELDEFDTFNTIYLTLLSLRNSVLGSVRLLPMEGPTMIGTVFRDLLSPDAPPISGAIVESSRFFVDTDAIEGPANPATELLMSSMVGWAAARGYDRIVTVTDVRIERLMRRIGIPFIRLSSPQRLGSTTAVVLSIPADEPLHGVRLQPAA